MKKFLTMVLAVAMVASLAACGSSSSSSSAASSSAASSSAASSSAASSSAAAESTEEESTEAESTEAESTEAESTAEAATTDGEKSIGFVILGLGNEFFENIVAAYTDVLTADGWDATYVSGEYDVDTQINAIENYTAQQVDVLVVFPVSGQAVAAAVSQARAAGVKVIAMVEDTVEWDGYLSSDNYTTGQADAWLAAQWIEETYPDAEPGSIPVALIQVFDTATDEQQSNGLESITDYTDKVSVIKYETAGQNKEDGQKAAETLYVSNPEVKIFVTTSNVVALGIDSFYTGMSSPVSAEDLADYAAFGTNASEEAITGIVKSATNECILRGINIQAGIQETAENIRDMADGLLDGTYDQVEWPANVYLVNASNVQEYIDNGTTALMWDYDLATAVEN